MGGIFTASVATGATQRSDSAPHLGREMLRSHGDPVVLLASTPLIPAGNIGATQFALCAISVAEPVADPQLTAEASGGKQGAERGGSGEKEG